MVGVDFSASAIAAARNLGGDGGGRIGRASWKPIFTTHLMWFPSRTVSIWSLSHGEQSAGCRIFGGGAKSSRRCCAPAARCISPMPIPRLMCWTTPGAPRTACRDFLLPTSRATRLIMIEERDYIDPEAVYKHPTSHTLIHPLGDIVTGLIEAGMRLDWLHEHDAMPWRMFEILVKGADGLYRWPDKPWLPLAFSLTATRG